MQYLVLNEALQAWEAELARPDTVQAPLLHVLAWHLRQRDAARAQALLQRCLQQQPPPGALELARLGLIQAEHAVLRVRVAQAEPWLLAAEGLDDALLQCDAALLRGSLAILNGQSQHAEACFERAAAWAVRAGDGQRQRIAEVRRALSLSYRDPVAGRAHAGLWAEIPADPALAAWVLELQGTHAAQASDYGLATSARIQAFEAALQSGQIERAIVSAHNAAAALHSLNDLDLSLQWLERATQLARTAGWPGSIALALGQFGDTLRRLGRMDDALEVLQEARAQVAVLPQARLSAIMLRYWSDLLHDRGDWPRALQAYAELAQRGEGDGHPDLFVNGCVGQARVLAKLQRWAEAEQLAQLALSRAQQSSHLLRQIDALRVLAELHADPQLLPAPVGVPAADAALHYLRQAQQLAQAMPGFHPPPELLEGLASEWARRGDWAQAGALMRAAHLAWQRQHLERAQKRAIALRAMQRIEQARADAAHQRELAAELALRSAALREASAMLERLSEVGREITAGQGLDRLFDILCQHLRPYLPEAAVLLAQLREAAPAVRLWLADAAGRVLARGDAAELAQQGLLARCSGEQRSVSGALQALPELPARQQLAEELLWHAEPLLLGARCLGVLAVQPQAPPQELQQQWLRNLGAFAAIALAHAQAHERLASARARLVAQERRVALGAMVAGVAHELNTPLGNGLMASSAWREDCLQLGEGVRSRQLRRQDVQRYFERCQGYLALMQRSLARVLTLVQRYREAGGPAATGRVERVDLALLAQRALQQACRSQGWAGGRVPAGLQLQLDLPAGLWLQSRPDVLEQVLSQLLDNALRHGLAGRTSGLLRLCCERLPGQLPGPLPGRLRLHVQDDGAGIAPEHQARVFDPFFSTRFGQGGSGLGLHMCRQWVHSLLDGELQLLHSSPGAGSDFALDLPMPEA